MCGIAGVVRPGSPAESLVPRARRMASLLRHRGPDGEGLHSEPGVALAHTRLSLLDHPGGAQPLRSPDGRYTLVYNGELYNAPALRARLDDRWRFRTRSDGEVVLAALACLGDEALPLFDGMFALFLWDRDRGVGLGARDRLGVKPLAFHAAPGELVFASEPQAIARTQPHGAHPAADLAAVTEVLVAPCFSGVERSAFAGVELLPAGHLLEFGPSGVRLRPWWRPALPEEQLGRDVPPGSSDETQLIERLRAEVTRAAAEACAADVPVGLFLSGGLDSSLLASRMRGHLAGGGRPAAFSVRIPWQAREDFAGSRLVIADDAPFAALAARELDLDPVEVPLDPATLEDDIAAVAAANDAIPAWEQERTQHHLSRVAARTHKAVLVGDAADETHFGYHFLLDDEAIADPAVIVRRLGPVPTRPELTGGAEPVEWMARRYRALMHEEEGAPSARSRAGRVLGMTRLVLLRWLPRLLANGDAHAMRFGLEARVPYASPPLVDAALAIPVSLGLRGGQEKHALRLAAKGLVPEPIRRRRKSALPKDLRVGEAMRRAAARVLDERHPLIEATVDTARVRERLSPGRPLDERDRAALFRVAALARWAEHFGVGVP